MALINSVYPTYVQRSKLFLYPALHIKRGQSISLISTYLGVQNEIQPEDIKLVALYYLREDIEFRMFESGFLIGNPLFEQKKSLDENRALYIFDFNKGDLAHNFQCVLKGKYSQITEAFKRIILEYYEDNPVHHAYVNSFLYPEHYFDIYADFFIVNEKDKAYIQKLLKTVGELCSIPDMEREILNFDPNPVAEKEIFIPLSGNQQ